MRRVLNFLVVPIKLILIGPFLGVATICYLAGQEDLGDKLSNYILDPWF